jgi:hypothetical protein
MAHQPENSGWIRFGAGEGGERLSLRVDVVTGREADRDERAVAIMRGYR